MYYTYHAVLRMNQRGISPAWVLWAVFNGAYNQQPDGRYRVIAPYNNGANAITVILSPDQTVVITTWWN